MYVYRRPGLLVRELPLAQPPRGIIIIIIITITITICVFIILLVLH